MVIGLMLGIILALLLEYLDNTARSSEDVATKLGAPILSILQWVRGKGELELQRAYLDNFNPAFTEARRICPAWC